MPKRQAKEPVVPVERPDTIRKHIVSLLEEYTMSAKELSSLIKIAEKDVYDHLEHIRKTLNKGNLSLHHEPAACERCGFIFQKRDRLSKPGKCPLCRSRSILPPLFRIDQ